MAVPQTVKDFAQQIADVGGQVFWPKHGERLPLAPIEGLECYALPNGRFGVWLVYIGYGGYDVRGRVIEGIHWGIHDKSRSNAKTSEVQNLGGLRVVR